MNIKQNFKRIGSVNIQPLLSAVDALEERVWHQFLSRQQRFKVHCNTQSIPLLFDDEFRYFLAKKRPLYSEFECQIEPILKLVESAYISKGFPLRLLLTRLKPRSEISPHKDKGSTLKWVHRIHIPVITNEEVYFEVGGERRNLKSGEVWEINNARVHAVRNDSMQSRVHLILDWVTVDLAQGYLRESCRTAMPLGSE